MTVNKHGRLSREMVLGFVLENSWVVPVLGSLPVHTLRTLSPPGTQVIMKINHLHTAKELQSPLGPCHQFSSQYVCKPVKA